MIILSSIFIVLHFVLEAFTLLKHLCLCLCLCLSTFQVLEEVLQAFELSACPMSDSQYCITFKIIAILVACVPLDVDVLGADITVVGADIIAIIVDIKWWVSQWQ